MMNFLAARSLPEVLTSLGSNIFVLIISCVVLLYILYLLLALLSGFINGVNKSIKEGNERGDYWPAFFWAVVGYLIYWYWFR
jgi:phosphotransferase system  glucose/maltose/N-acetylglucosamine-specific IIC component